MRHRLPGAVLAALALACALPASAQNYVVRDGNGAFQTMASKTLGGIQYPIDVMAGLYGGNPTSLSADAFGNLNINVVSLPASSTVIGKFGIDQSTPGTTNGVQLAASIPTGTNNIGTVGVAQGSTTSGEYGPLVQGAVITGTSSYTNGQTQPLNLDGAGNLKVNIVAGAAAGGTSSAFASAFPTQGTAMGAKNGSNMVNLTADGLGNLSVQLCGNGTTNCGAVQAAGADAVSNTASGAQTYDRPSLFNGSTWDRQVNVSGASGGSGAGVAATHFVPNSSANVGIVPISSTALESSHVLKASAGNLYRLRITSTVGGYLMLFNATSAPADGAVTPQSCTQVAGGTAEIDHSDVPDRFSTGIVAVFSTTGCFSKTASASAMFEGSVE